MRHSGGGWAHPGHLPIADAHPAITAHLRRVLEQLIEGKAVPADYTADMQSITSEAGLREYLKAQGPISSFELVGQREENDQRELHYKVRMQERILTFTFRLDKSQTISRMGFSG